MSTPAESGGADPPVAPATDVDQPTTESSSPQDQLAELIAKATAEYAVKHYSEAAEFYSQAAELQDEINGEMALENADLLYSYGKCLYFLAQQTSSVLGGTAASAQLSSNKGKKAPRKKKEISNGHASSSNGQSSSSHAAASSAPAADALPNVGDVVPESDIKPTESSEPTSADRPLFQISGDDVGWNSDESEEEDGEDPETQEEEEDDFATAYELLDLARVLYLRKLDQIQESKLAESDKGKYVASIDLTPEVRNLKSRIADIYDLQAEVNLEGEKYASAVTDLTACLALNEELEKPESSILAECHYKLSLALEFSSQSQQRDEDGNPFGDLEVDWKIRNEAVTQQEKAIECCKLRVTKEKADLEKLEAGHQKDKAMAQIEDVQDMISEMEVRLAELRKPPVNVKAETESQMVREQISGVLGSILGGGGTEAEKKEKLAQVSETANDLSGLVKRKKAKGTTGPSNGGDSGVGSAASTPAPTTTSENLNGSGSKGKRKVGFVDEVEDNENGKKAKVEDAEDTGL
ncbi:hypothetical protein B0A52_02526 [Exophiala mesophila]|uniref:Tetratricopeptide SHNi-TPR domain-containing protein n=1 Tax=Exophiala mesophila TaxID=212818 RepID=A0A438ND88_EXOME|nr:hypothetical protein B0A52_02526 [Exophiala mesophila]